MTRIKNIFIIGFSGSGKSTVGKALAKALRVRFFDTDQMVVSKARSSIQEIFARRGERAFRRLEHGAIAQVVSERRNTAVVALGGGAFQSSRNRKLVRNAGTVVYLSCSQPRLYQRLRNMNGRPLLHGSKSESHISGVVLKMRIRKLLKLRRDNYNLADIKISTTHRTVGRTVRELVRKIGEIDAHN